MTIWQDTIAIKPYPAIYYKNTANNANLPGAKQDSSMITKTSLTMKRNQEEDLKELTAEFPYSAVYGDINRYVGGFVPWHWHEAIEIIHILRGNAAFYVQDSRFDLGEGDALFVNANKLHMVKPDPGCDHVFFHTLLFDARLLTGQYGSAFDRKYVAPVLGCQEISGLHFPRGCERHECAIELLRASYTASVKESFGYEFKIRELLSRLWLIILEESGEKLKSAKPRGDVNAERIKAMLNFIHENYRRKIGLRDISAASNVSERECLRCFGKMIGMTPFEYLTQYRVRAAAEMLVSSDENIIGIGESTGFSSASYFGKTFKSLMGCTPREYRRKSDCRAGPVNYPTPSAGRSSF